MSVLRPAVLLDRDGTLNTSTEGWITRPEDLVLLPGALEAAARLTAAGWPVAIVTNQSCIGRGRADAGDVDRVHDELLRRAEAAGARFEGIHVCPHAPDDGCSCRKPLPGLLARAARAHGYDLFRSYMVGDSHRDLLAGRAAGATPLLVLTGKEDEARERHPEHLTFRTLSDAVDWILSRTPERTG